MADGTLKVGTITTSSGSGTITLGQSGETVDMANGSITLNSGMKAIPGFYAFLTTSQTGLSDAATVKLTPQTEVFDSGTVYDNSTNYRFTPGVAGKYNIFAGALLSSGGTDNMREAEIYIYKNGSSISKCTFNFTNNYANVATPTLNIVVDVSLTTDYYELYGQVNTQSGDWQAIGDSTQHRTYFGAYRIIGA